MNLFFDTEFTDFRESELLSIGVITEDDRSLYLEVHDSDRWSRATAFCHEFVLPMFGQLPDGIARSDRALGQRLADWMEGLAHADGELVLHYDYKLDVWHLEQALREAGRLDALQRHMRFIDLGYLAGNKSCLSAQETYFSRLDRPHPELMRHHALVDALALRASWRVMHRPE